MHFSRIFIMLALTTISSMTVCAISAPDQAQAAPQPTASKDFLSFWTTFKDALRKNDKNAIADMTKFPYTYNDKKLDKAEFIAKSEKIFSAAIRKCLLVAKPVPDKNSVFVFCGHSIYIFAKDQGKYKFTEIGEND